MRILFAFLACCLLTASCKKKNSYNTPTLIGNWILTEEQRIGQAWQTVPPSAQKSFTLKADSTFTFNPSMISSATPCSGTFRTSRDTLIMNWDCSPGPSYQLQMVYSVQDVLLLDYFTTATGLKEKYRRN